MERNLRSPCSKEGYEANSNSPGRKEMKAKVIVLTACIISMAIAGEANAAGCLKGAAAGGVAGHFVGNGHAAVGAAGGCAVGHHMAAKKAKQERQDQQAAQQGQSQAR
jgi:outer membrane lipoprotein SlyB